MIAIPKLCRTNFVPHRATSCSDKPTDGAMAQVHPADVSGGKGAAVAPALDEEAPTAAEPSKLSGLSAKQVELKTSERSRTLAVLLMLAFAFVDCLGTVLFAPAGGALCQRAKGGPSEQLGNMLLLPTGALETDELKGLIPAEIILVHKELDAEIPCSGANPKLDAHMVYPLAPWGTCTKAAGDATTSKEDACADGTWTPNPEMPCLLREAHTPASAKELAWSRQGNPKAFKTVPFGFSMSMNVVIVAGQLSEAAGGLVWGIASDKVGVKICSLLCLLGGIGGYTLMYLAGVSWGSYWAFIAGNVVNGLFSGSMTLVNSYILKVVSNPADLEKWLGVLYSFSAVGAGLGALILMPFISGRGENVFNAAWIGIGASALIFVLIAGTHTHTHTHTCTPVYMCAVID